MSVLRKKSDSASEFKQ